MKLRLIAVVAATCGAYAAADAAVLLGVASYANFTQQGLYRIDTNTGAATLIGNTGLVNINGISFDGSTGTLYAYTTTADLYKIDVNTGASILIGANLGIVPEGDIAITGGAAFATNAGQFGSISIGSGAYTTIGAMGNAADDVSGLAFDATGGLFGYSKNGGLEDTLIRIDTATGSATTVGGTGLSSISAVGGLAFDGDLGVMFLTDGAALYSVNTSTGAAGFIGSHGVADFSGLAVIPAPGAGLIFAFGAAASLRRRR